METMKLNVWSCEETIVPEARPSEGVHAHLWSSAPTVETTELGPAAWFECGRCPARVLHDPETEDGFPEEPVVVYPPSCFDEPAAAGDPTALHHAPEPMLSGTTRCGLYVGPVWSGCGCPRTASGAVVHLQGCVGDAACCCECAAEPADACADPICRCHTERASFEHQPTERVLGVDCSTCGIGFQWIKAPRTCPACGAAQTNTDPAPPSEELARAIEHHLEERDPWLDAPLTDEEVKAFKDVEREIDEDDIPTQRYPATFIESGGSIFERVEALFGRPLKFGDDAGMDMVFDALGGIDG